MADNDSKSNKKPKRNSQRDTKQLRVHLGRAGVGLAITGGAVAAIVLVGSFAMPQIELEPASATIDTAASATRTLTCAGSALELGADPTRPLLALPMGATTLTLQDATGYADKTSNFARESDSSGGMEGAGTGVMLQVDGDQVYAEALAESEIAQSSALKGLVTTQCIEATNESWIVGGTTTLGSVTLLSLTNPGDVPATVFVNVYDDKGLVESLQSTGVVVPEKSQRTVSINGAAPERGSLAVQVLSRGAKVVATMQESLVQGLNAMGVDTVQGVAKPSTQLVIPGVTTPIVAGVNTVDDHGHDRAGHTLRVLAPGDTGGIVKVTGVNAEGTTVKLVSEYVHPQAVTEFALEELTEEFTTVVVDAEVPVVASVTGLGVGATGEDIAWFTAAPAIDREIAVAVPDGPDAQLTLYNPSDEAVIVDLVAGQGNTPDANLTITLPARSSVRQAVKANSGYQLLTGTAVFAALSFTGDGLLSGFPIVPPAGAAETVQVYTR